MTGRRSVPLVVLSFLGIALPAGSVDFINEWPVLLPGRDGRERQVVVNLQDLDRDRPWEKSSIEPPLHYSEPNYELALHNCGRSNTRDRVARVNCYKVQLVAWNGYLVLAGKQIQYESSISPSDEEIRECFQRNQEKLLREIRDLCATPYYHTDERAANFNDCVNRWVLTTSTDFVEALACISKELDIELPTRRELEKLAEVSGRTQPEVLQYQIYAQISGDAPESSPEQVPTKTPDVPHVSLEVQVDSPPQDSSKTWPRIALAIAFGIAASLATLVWMRRNRG